MARFDEADKDDQCRYLNLEYVPPRLAPHIGIKCFANAFSQKSFPPSAKFLKRAGKGLLNEIDLDTIDVILSSGEFWAALSKEQIQQMITKDANVCRFLKAAPKGKSIDLPTLVADCVKVIEPEELNNLLLSSSIKAFEVDSLKHLTSDNKDLDKVLKGVASTRPELLKHLGSDAESDNACSQFNIGTIIKDHPSAAKLLPKNCYAAMTGLDDITLEDLPKLPEAAQEAVPIKELVEKLDGEGHFDKLEDKEWNKLMATGAFCHAASSEVLHKNAKFVKSLTAPCYSALGFDLEEKEIRDIQPAVIGQASDGTVAKHITKYTVPQISALGENIKKVTSLNPLSTEQVPAIQASAMKHVAPGALADLDSAHFRVITPEVFGVMTYDQLSKVPQATILSMTPDQARNLGKHVENKAQDPHRLFTPELHAS